MKNKSKFGFFCFSFIFIVLLLAGCARETANSPTSAPQTERDQAYEQTVEKQLESMYPAAVPIFKEATIAMDAGDLEKSKQLFTQLVEMAPDFSVAYRRLGHIAQYQNDLAGSIALYRKALQLEPDAYNQSYLAIDLVLTGDSTNFPEAYQLASAAAKTLPEDGAVILSWLLASASVDNDADLRLADAKLLQLSPSQPIAHYYAGYLAAIDGKWEKSEKELLTAQELGMPQESVQEMLDSGISKYALRARLFRGGVIATGAWLAGLGVLFAVGNVLSAATIKALKTGSTSINLQIKPEENRIRSLYRRLISVLSVYYYISIPFVILLLVIVVGGVLYVFLQIGSIPYQVIGILGVILFGSLFAILRSVISRQKDVPPGRALQRIEAPELWTLVEGVARNLAVRPVDAIYLSTGIAIAVNERGSVLTKMRGKGKRNLILGMGVLPGLTQGQLAAVLAHEYGHFSNRDTAGGNLAYQVQNSLHGMTQRLLQSRAAYFFNPVWLFVNTYMRIFLRVTRGASRLQEVLADRYAAMNYGSTSLIEGLKTLIRQGIAFPLQANYQLKLSQESHQPIVNFYDLPMPEVVSKEVEQQYDEALKRTTTPYDTHPAPGERIQWIEDLHVPYSPMHDNPAPALHLFPNPEELQRELTARINQDLRQ